MNMETSIAAATGLSKLDQEHLWRSKFIDKSAKCEAELRRLSQSVSDSKMHFKAMTEKVIASQKDSKTKHLKSDTLLKLLEELIPLIELRAELAHSHFLDSVSSDAGYAILKNANFSHIHFDKLTVISSDQRKKSYDRLSSITGQLATL
jgi:transketolase